jgi:mannosyltransferase
MVPAVLGVLLLVSLWLRTRQLGQGLWIDEGISIGIAHHHWSSIPGLMKQDGSPPAYYLLLGLWIRVFGDSERATHTLSLIFGLACIPAAYAAGRALFGRSTGLVCALLVALDPYLTYYAQETRMYELEALLSFVVAIAYVDGIIRARRAWAVALVLSLALMLYAHNWAIFLCLGLAAVTAVLARHRWKLFALVAAGVGVLYAPWIPTLLGQAKHTGAPWSTVPSFHELLVAPGAVLNGDAPYVALVLAGGAGLAAVVRRRGDGERAVVLALLGIVAATVIAAWISSQISPAWTTRYFAVVLGPLILAGARGLVLARRLGLAAAVVLVLLWGGYSVRNDKEDAQQVAARLAPSLQPGELVISTHPEQVPVLRYYLGPGLRWATTLGPVQDPRIFDWRDAVSRLRAAQTRTTLDLLVGSVPRGSELVVVAPVFRDYRAWRAKWTKLVWQKSTAFTAALQADPRLRLVQHVAVDEIAVRRNYFKPLQAFVYRRVG